MRILLLLLLVSLTARADFIIGDAGSSGLRLYNFNEIGGKTECFKGKWNDGDASPTNLDRPRNLENGGEHIADYWSKVVTQATTQCVNLPRTPIFLSATAGLRLLKRKEDGSKLTELFGRLKDADANLRPSGSIVTQVLEGRFEAFYGMLGAYEKSPNLREDVKKKSAIYLEVGGASVQVAFSADPNSCVFNPDCEHNKKVHQKYLKILNKKPSLEKNFDGRCQKKQSWRSIVGNRGYGAGKGLHALASRCVVRQWNGSPLLRQKLLGQCCRPNSSADNESSDRQERCFG